MGEQFNKNDRLKYIKTSFISILLVLGIVFVVIFSGCTESDKKQEITCNKPYILVGTGCCLDKNDNKICDKDE